MRVRVWPTDMDLNFHLNDGRYVSLSGLARVDLMLRNGLLRRALKRGWYPVVGGVVIRYRREIRAFEKFELHSRILGWDEKWFYFEHRFEKGGSVVALAYARGVMRTREGAVPPSDVLQLVEWKEASPPLPDAVVRWQQADIP
jgi:acyl-CoA thioesterase FadM